LAFLANVFAARGYLVASIQHDLPTDAPLITREGSLYVGRLRVYEQAEANILFAMDELKKIQPNAEYNHITLVVAFKWRRHINVLRPTASRTSEGSRHAR
jgi:hypothetical protein